MVRPSLKYDYHIMKERGTCMRERVISHLSRVDKTVFYLSHSKPMKKLSLFFTFIDHLSLFIDHIRLHKKLN